VTADAVTLHCHPVVQEAKSWLLRQYGYLPDKREEAVVTVIEQAEAVCRDWAKAA